VVVPPIFVAFLNHLIQSAKLAGAPVKFDPVYNKAISFYVYFKAAVLAEKLFPADNPKLGVAKWTQHKIPPSDKTYILLQA
jgi:hypothetical protein